MLINNKGIVINDNNNSNNLMLKLWIAYLDFKTIFNAAALRLNAACFDWQWTTRDKVHHLIISIIIFQTK